MIFSSGGRGEDFSRILTKRKSQNITGVKRWAKVFRPISSHDTFKTLGCELCRPRADPLCTNSHCPSCWLSFRLVYIFSYNLFQFCGHTWILANTIARFLTFGEDALADTFYSVGFVMSLCQLLSILELFHIADGIEKARLFPRFIQVVEKNVLLITLIMLEEIQSKPVVCVLLFLWNILDLLRYPHELLCVMEKPSITMLWTRYTLWIPVYILSAATEGVTIYQALPYLEPNAPKSPSSNSTVTTHLHLSLILMIYLPVLALGASITVWQLLKERQHHLHKWSKKTKKK